MAAPFEQRARSVCGLRVAASAEDETAIRDGEAQAASNAGKHFANHRRSGIRSERAGSVEHVRGYSWPASDEPAVMTHQAARSGCSPSGGSSSRHESFGSVTGGATRWSRSWATCREMRAANAARCDAPSGRLSFLDMTRRGKGFDRGEATPTVHEM